MQHLDQGRLRLFGCGLEPLVGRGRRGRDRGLQAQQSSAASEERERSIYRP
jgi:hypothetical protein